MYAIIETGGKQVKVEQGDEINVELLDSKDNKVEFNKVLFLSDGTSSHIGTPYLSRCIVKGELLEQVAGPKTIAFKYKKRKNYRRKVGHRQKYSRVKILEIEQKGAP